VLDHILACRDRWDQRILMSLLGLYVVATSTPHACWSPACPNSTSNRPHLHRAMPKAKAYDAVSH
jgi:hypothetical protein